jgi:hypothetical protein
MEKDPWMGVGGHLKRTADSHVLMGKDIKTALDFVNLFTESVIQVKVVPDDDIARAKNIVPKTLDAMPGIMNITKITWERGPEVLIRLYRYEHFHKELKLTTFSNNLNVKSIELMDVSIESPNPEKPMDTNDFEDLTFEKKQKSNSVQAGTSSYGKESLHPNLISTGTFLLIKVPTQKINTHYRYVATCQTCVDKDDGEILVTFLRSVRNSARKFKLELNDVSYIAFDQIISIIPTPLLKKEQNREYYYFDADVYIFEKF